MGRARLVRFVWRAAPILAGWLVWGAAAGFFAAVTSRPAAAAEMKIGYINSEEILKSYSEVATALEGFNRDVEGWNAEAVNRKKELDEMGRELQAQSPMLSDDKRREMEQDYQRKLTEYDQFVQSIWGPNGLVVKRNEEVLRPIIARIQTILAKIGAEEGYDLILDAADGNILFADPELDLTSRVLQDLSSQQP